MQGKNKAIIRNLEAAILGLIKRGQSAMLFGPRQTGKTTLIKRCLAGVRNKVEYLLQNPEIRMELEKDPALMIRQLAATRGKPYVFVDEAQKVPDLFDAMQYLIDEKTARFLITGSSARKLKRKGTNLLPGRVKTFRLDPLCWNELGWVKHSELAELKLGNINRGIKYSLEQSLIFGSLPGIVGLENNQDRREFLQAYAQIYLEEEIRAESLSRKIGAFSRFLELAANESGTSPNLTKLSQEAGVSAPAIKEYFSLLEDTLVVTRLDPYLKNARKRILASSRYYFVDLGVRNSLARLPMEISLINAQKGRLFEHAVILEIARRIHSLGRNYSLHYWRTSGGAEVDCVINLGNRIVPIEIKASRRVTLSEIKGLTSFLDDYPEAANRGYVVTLGDRPEKLTEKITALPWNWL